jgi:hypothetical protein
MKRLEQLNPFVMQIALLRAGRLAPADCAGNPQAPSMRCNCPRFAVAPFRSLRFDTPYFPSAIDCLEYY